MKALVTGIGGQDGFWMAKLLLKHQIKVVGITSRPEGIAQIEAEFSNENFSVYALNYSVRGLVDELIETHRPDFFFNFAALATGSGMFQNPATISRVNGEFVLDILEATRTIHPKMRIFQASSAEMYGDVQLDRFDEIGPFNPKSPYGAAKLYAHNLVSVYRKAFGLHAVSAILFNHESVRRPVSFVTRKISSTAAQIKLGLANELRLGSLDTVRDWGYAPEYAEAMFRMTTNPLAKDYVIATGRQSTVRNLCEIAFGYLDLNYQDYVRIDENYARSIETKVGMASPERIYSDLGWSAKTTVDSIITEMVDHDLRLLSNRALKANRFQSGA